MRWSAWIPAGLLARSIRRRALREFENLQQQEAWTLAFDDGNLVNRAKVALKAGERVAAEHLWQEALRRYPFFAKSSHDSLELLLGLQRFDEAEALMLAGLERSRDPFYSEGYALVAERRGDPEEAVRRWDAVRKKFPGYWKSYVDGAYCLCKADRLEAAERLSAKAISLFPSEVRAWLASATVAEHRHDWLTAARRWEIVCDKFGHFHGDIGVARALVELGRIDEAEQRLKEAQSRHPIAHEIAVARARLADQTGDKEEAVMRWADSRRRFPLLPFGYQGGFRQLLEMGRHMDAEAILLAAIDRFPEEAWPRVEHALLAHTRKDWPAASTRWAVVRTGWPDRPDGFLRGAEALAALGRPEQAAQLSAEHRLRSAPQTGGHQGQHQNLP